jgi:hypothetical protein
MNKEQLEAFNKELRELLTKYDVSLSIEDVPATKRIAVVSNKKEISEVASTSDQK